MEEYSKDLLRLGIIEAKAGSKESARRYLDRAIYMTQSFDILAEAWFWMNEVVTDPVEKRKALENCLSHDMRHARARRALAILDGKLKADEIINPDQLPAVPEGLRHAQRDSQRFMCPKCGARMSFAPDGRQTLVCDYCSRHQVIGAGSQEAEEQDFIIAMATARGHGKPLQEQVFQCKGCGAEFILPPNQISASCVYCDSPHVVSLEKTKDLLAPDGIIPHVFDQKRAVKLLIDWVEGNNIKPEKKVELPRGLYLPLWTFDVGGAVDYTYEIVQANKSFKYRQLELAREEPVRITNQYPIMVNDLPLPASKKPSSVFLRLIPTFDMQSIQPYDPRFLASWPAEIYDVPMADASLDARSQAYKKFKRDLPHLINNNNIVHTSSENLVIESFKLNLLPVWMTELPFNGRKHLVLINGQNGVISSDILDNSGKTDGLLDFLADLLGD
jgi:DNA-directed RNA polymerase subunit RPC12/RpoP